jgi:diaminopimelate decarboxylase
LKTAIGYPKTVIRYACKALTLQAVLKIVRRRRSRDRCLIVNEVMAALRAGFLPVEIFYTGEGATFPVYEQLVQKGVLINCTSIDPNPPSGQGVPGPERLFHPR